MQSTRRRFVLAAALVPAASVVHAQPKEPVALRDYREVPQYDPAWPELLGDRLCDPASLIVARRREIGAHQADLSLHAARLAAVCDGLDAVLL